MSGSMPPPLRGFSFVVRYIISLMDDREEERIEGYRDNDRGRAMANGFEVTWRDSMGRKSIREYCPKMKSSQKNSG